MPKKRFFRQILVFFLILTSLILPPRRCNADFFGGDIPLLMEIVVNTLAQLIQLKNLLDNGSDTLRLLQDVNEGIRQAMDLIQTMNRTLNPGILSQYRTPEEVLRAIEDIYGAIPKTTHAKTEAMTDQSIAEAVALHNQAFEYASLIDPEAERIKDYARQVSPAGASKLTAQSVGVLIHVSNQILRTNAALLKMMSENVALQNRREKVNSENFRMQYEGLSNSLGGLPSMKDSLSMGQ